METATQMMNAKVKQDEDGGGRLTEYDDNGNAGDE